jgi:hypothetical protein
VRWLAKDWVAAADNNAGPKCIRSNVHRKTIAYLRKEIAMKSANHRSLRMPLLGALLGALLFTGACSAPAPVANFTSALSLSNVTERAAGFSSALNRQSVPVRMLLAATNSAIEVATDEYLGSPVNINQLVRNTTGIDMGLDPQPNEIATLSVVNKTTNDVQSWTLSPDVKSIQLLQGSAENVELKVINESPLRIELWVDGSPQVVEAEFELR